MVHDAWWYIRGIRVKTSVSLPESLLAQIDQHAENRSAFLEAAPKLYIQKIERDAALAHDAAILDRWADNLNREAAEVLQFQRVR
ncbi:MAG: ribbon-helix-helix domain-containing protein [Bryobacter sp.]|nr:ribbon-helix-helix domain-containing protein [Bryobacter sp.]